MARSRARRPAAEPASDRQAGSGADPHASPGPLWPSLALRIDPADSPLEREAETTAARVVSNGSEVDDVSGFSPGGVSVQRKCASCELEDEHGAKDDELRVQRHADAGAPPSARAGGEGVAGFLGSDAGQPLDPGSREYFGSRFASDFSDVRIHTGPEAADSARSINAVAYTAGRDIVFGEKSPERSSADGQRLLAHELIHVMQQRGGARGRLQRQVDVTHSTIDPATLAGFDEARLRGLEDQAGTALAQLPPGTSDYDAVRENVQVIERELAVRGASFGSSTIPRPRALPVDEGFMLTPAANLPADVAEMVPEGVTVSVPAAALQPPQTKKEEKEGLPPVSAGATVPKALLEAVNAQLKSAGFASAGDTAIGIVAIRQPPPLLPKGAPLAHAMRVGDIAAPTKVWGHTAIYVRQGGRITQVTGFSPRISELLTQPSKIESGSQAVTGIKTPDANLFLVPDARVLEYPVNADVAASVAARIEMASTTPIPKGYTARPSVWAAEHPGVANPFSEVSNCGLWACSELEAALGGKVGPAGAQGAAPISVTEVARRSAEPVPGTASQRALMQFLDDAAAGKVKPSVPVGAIGEPVAAEMPQLLRILKVGGRVMFVVSIATVPLEILFAPPGRRARAAIGATSGLLGGLAGGAGAGAAAGLVCGPGAPVCSFILALLGGLAGYFGARKLTERAYDVATEFYPTEVADLMKELSELLAEYGVIIGALTLAQRTVPSLTGIGASDPTEVRSAAQQAADAHRAEARDKELEILRSFESAYKRARTSFAGLRELDELRAEFMAMQAQANPKGEEVAAWQSRQKSRDDSADHAWQMHPSGQGIPPNILRDLAPKPDLRTTRDIAAETFARIDKGLTLDDMTATQVNDLEQWRSIDRALENLHGLAFHRDPTRFDAGDWEGIAEKQREVMVMMRNARYRLTSADQPGARRPLLTPGTVAWTTYEARLDEREQRFALFNGRFVDATQGVQPPGVAGAQSPAEHERLPAAGGLDTPIDMAERGVRTFEQLLGEMPPMPAEVVAAAPADRSTKYNTYVEGNNGFALALRRLEACEHAMVGLFEGTRATLRVSGGSGPERLNGLIARGATAVQMRREKGYLYEKEAAAAGTDWSQATRAYRIRALALLFGQSLSAEALAETEKLALTSDELEKAGRRLGIVSDQLERMQDLPTVGADGYVRGVFRVTSGWNSRPVPQNALVGDIGPGWTVTYLYGDEPARKVLPLNRAAIGLFGDVESREIESRYLASVKRTELTL